MKIKDTYTWECDSCNAVSDKGALHMPPSNWRFFDLREHFHGQLTPYTSTLIYFCVCEICHKDKYHNMHPIRKALTICGVLK